MIVTSETPEERAEQAFSGWFAPGSDARDRLIAIAAGQIRAARLEALEEAAKIVESLADANIMNGPCEKVYAEAIRELGKK